MAVGHVSIDERAHSVMSVFVDGVDCGTTPWEGNLEVGQHEVAARSATLTAAARSFTVQPGATVAIELVATARNATTIVSPDSRADLAPPAPPWHPSSPAAAHHPGAGWYGGILANALFEPGGTNTDICAAPEVTACSVSAPLGGGLLGYAGYASRPLGIDALIGLQVDSSQASGTINGTSDTIAVPRVGFLFAVRARWWVDTSTLRFSAGVGVGAAARALGAIGGGATSAGYVAPAVTADVAVHWPIASSVAFSLGLMLWVENAGSDATVEGGPLTSPVHAVSSTQAFVLPIAGLEFGP